MTKSCSISFLLGAAIGLTACGTSSSSSDTTCVADPNDVNVVCVTEPLPQDSQHAYQGVKARVGFYPSDQCTPGTEAMVLEYDLSQTCFGWRRPVGSSTHDNSATHFACYRDRVCYTQHTQNLTCQMSATDKEFRTDACILDDSGGVWLKLLSGTESCPAPPAGFSCTTSSPGQGTAGTS
jgi:hypothetical protein